VIRLKNILLESKVGHLVEKEETFKAKSTKSDRVIVYKSKDAMDKAIKAGRAEPLDKKDKIGDTKKGDVFKKDDKPNSKKDQEKAQKAASKKEKTELEKIKKAKIVVREPGKPDKEIAIEDILSDPFGKAKDNDEHPQAKKAKKKVYEMYKERYGKEGKAEVKKRLKNKDKNGDPILTKEEQTLYEREVERVKQENEENKNDEWYEEKPIPNKSSFLNDKITDEYNKKADYFDPEGEEWGGSDNYWSEKSGGDEGMFGDFDLDDDDDDFDFDDDFGDAKSDDFGQPLSKLGSKQQQSALELKVKVPVGSLKKVKLSSNHRVTNQDGNPTKLSVFQDEKSKKYYGIDDEGNIYENDTDDFRDMKEPTADAKGFPGAVTSKGQSLIDKRAGKQKEDEYDKTSFADLLDLLGIDTDIDYTNPFAGN
jgi:hypothetical protein